jgi:lipoprotein-anchoring transpeptidase ErfK/SrfK
MVRRRSARRRFLGSLLALPAVALLARLSPRAGCPVHADGTDNLIPILIPDDVGQEERWVAVNLTAQAAVGMIGVDPVHVALVTTGKPGWETPIGQFRILRRVENETMTSASLGITDPDDQYVLTNVLYTQYFTWVGHALHLNYWRPDSVFGREPTSHGCVGMRLDDARFFWDFLGIGSRVVVHT